MKSKLLAFVLSLELANPALAQTSRCSDRTGVAVWADSVDPEDAMDDVAGQLAAGLASSNIQVCLGRGVGALARVEVLGQSWRSSATIRIVDRVTGKTLERSVDVSRLPADTRPVALALYIEELLQASWAEIALQREQRAELPRTQPAAPPVEVKREVERVLLPRPGAARGRTIRLSLGALAARFQGGLPLQGPAFTVGWHARRWLEPALRIAHGFAPRTRAAHGSIQARSTIFSAVLSLSYPLNRTVSALFPQGVDLANTVFLGAADAGYVASSAYRRSLVIWHGLGLRVGLGDALSLSLSGVFCWTALPAEAAEDGRKVVGISGLGGQAELSLDAHF